MKKTILLVALLAAAAGASAQQYKWVDKNGRLQYGDTPPPGVKATALRAPAPAAPAAPAVSNRKGPAAVSDRERQRQAQGSEDEAAKKLNCANAQDQLRMLQSGQRIMRLDPKGERYYLEDAQIQQESAQARQAIQQWCS